MHNYESYRKMSFDLDEFGGNHDFTLEELVSEIVTNRRDRFIHYLFEREIGIPGCHHCFDAISFKAATEDFTELFNHASNENFEGYIVYKITAGSDNFWKLKTSITWENNDVYSGGFLYYHTDVLETNVNRRINGLTGTLMEVLVLEKNLCLLDTQTVFEREDIIFALTGE